MTPGYNGTDLNEDGEPDFGFCHFPREGAGYWAAWPPDFSRCAILRVSLIQLCLWFHCSIQDWWWAEIVYAIWATYSQTQDIPARLKANV